MKKRIVFGYKEALFHLLFILFFSKIVNTVAQLVNYFYLGNNKSAKIQLHELSEQLVTKICF
jgi:hypothetical protein